MATVVQAGERRSAPVESMRALAALAVLAFHAQLVIRLYDHRPVTNELLSKIVSIGSQGVFLFFTLTGYLLFRPFAQRAWGSRLPVDVRRYALNRVLRILPLYYFAIVVLLLAQEHGGTFTQWWRFGLFM
ncbi:MAG: acyltransferase family protein, partial [Frankiales bacterium]|nr:acyltransferase family protein [Frankiales bacterium]